MTQDINIKFQVGDSVKVKSGTKDPDFLIDIGGWRGQIAEVDNDSICITWDSVTLSTFPDKYISQCEEDGLNWEVIYLETKDVELVVPRNTGNDLHLKQQEIQSKHRWDYLGDSGMRIRNILNHIDPEDDLAAFEAWENYLSEFLSFPFEAKISDCQNRSPLQQGDRVRIHSIFCSEDLYGVIIKLRSGRKVYHFPLCDIEALDEKSQNHLLLHDYSEWFANR